MDREEIENRFGYHPPRSTARVRDHEFARGRCKDLAYQLSRLLPEGREKSLVLTKLEEAMFWANASLARSPDLDATASEEEAAAGPRVNLLPREEDDPTPVCTAIAEDGRICGFGAFGHIVMGGGKKWPMCEYHWREDDSGHPKERFQ